MVCVKRVEESLQQNNYVTNATAEFFFFFLESLRIWQTLVYYEEIKKQIKTQTNANSFMVHC